MRLPKDLALRRIRMQEDVFWCGEQVLHPPGWPVVAGEGYFDTPCEHYSGDVRATSGCHKITGTGVTHLWPKPLVGRG